MSNSDNLIDESVLLEFLDESSEALAGLSPLFVRLEKDPTNKELINSIFRPIHSIKGNAPYFGLMRLKTLSHEFESLLASMRKGGGTWGKETFDLLLDGVDELRGMMTRISNHQPEVIDELRFEELLNRAKSALEGESSESEKQLKKLRVIIDTISTWELSDEQTAVVQELTSVLTPLLGQKTVSTPEVSDADSQTAATTSNSMPVVSQDSTPETSPSQKVEPAKTMRVAEDRIDTFLEFVGELVVAQDMLRYFSVKFDEDRTDPNLSRDLSTIIDVITTLGTGLEKAIMSIRRVPVKTLLQKVPRTIRDIAQIKSKAIDVCIIGDDIEIDKSMLELLDAPLMHMARNAADHGIEAPAVRTKAGKSESGTVIITCEEYEKEITLSVKDDGGGLNYEALRSKAVSLDIIPEDATLTEAQVVNLLFMSGVSTATEVSDISGRGVGMDVVKKNIESAGGKITIKSEAGEGSSFTIRLPKSVTTQIMQGFLFEVGSVQYVIPLSSVHECWVLDPQQITEVIGRGECAARHGEMIKIIDLATVFESEPEPTGVNQLVITVEVEHRLVGFRVSKIFGTRQLVIKPLGQLVADSQMFLGGAILGNGEVALLCDITKLVEDRFEQGASQSLTSM